MRKIVFELCAESVEACMAARSGGADRIELCSALSEGGLTPSHGLTRAAIDRSGLPIHVMLRPRGGDFIYTDIEFDVMCQDLEHFLGLGVSGFVVGILHADATVDVERTQRLVTMAAPLEVTFHRAFDEIADLGQGLEDVIHTGCARILTSGGKHDVESGAHALAALVAQAAGRIHIAVGGGLRLQNAILVARSTGATHFHGSMKRFIPAAANSNAQDILDDPEPVRPAKFFVDDADIRDMIERLSLV
jgi:copper homeostasis protein